MVAPWDHFDHLRWEDVLAYVQAYEVLPTSDLVRLMLHGDHAGREPSGSPTIGPTMLSAAVRCYSRNPNPADMTLQLLDRLGPSAALSIVRKADNNGSTALMDACRTLPPAVQVVKMLLSVGAAATVNATDATGASALMLASRNDFTPAVQLLLEHGADTDTVDTLGHSALWYSCEAQASGPATALITADAAVRAAEALSCARAAAPLVASPGLSLLAAFLSLLVAGLTLWRLSGVGAPGIVLFRLWPHKLEDTTNQPPREERGRKRRPSRDPAAESTTEAADLPAKAYRFLQLRARPHYLLIAFAPIMSMLVFLPLHLPFIHGLAYLAGMLIVASFYPETGVSRSLTQRQQGHQLFMFRGVTFIWTVHSVARLQFTRFNAIGFEPRHIGSGDEHPLRLALAVLTGDAPIRMSSWVRLCCTFHSMIILLLLVPLVPAALQLNQWARRHFPPWYVLRVYCVFSGMNDLMLLGSTYLYLRVASADGAAPGLYTASASVLVTQILKLVPVPLCGLLLTFDALRCELSRWSRSLLTKLDLPLLFGQLVDAAKEPMDADSRMCVVCLDEEITQILAPCGHKCVCASCAPLLIECPMCRAPVASVVSKVWDC